MVGGVAKVTHHITWDSLNSDGTRRVTTSGIADYLNRMGYQPHFVIDPMDGQTIQLALGSEAGAALAHPGGAPETNRSGSCNLQIEWLFTPGTVWNGRRYDSLLDTPMMGLDAFLDFAAGWGVPLVSAENGRDLYTWQNVAGHYGHQNVPYNDHTDPQCSIQGILDKAGIIHPPTEEIDVAYQFVTPDDKTRCVTSDWRWYTKVVNVPASDWLGSAGVKFVGKVHPDVFSQMSEKSGDLHYFGRAAELVLKDHNQG